MIGNRAENDNYNLHYNLIPVSKPKGLHLHNKSMRTKPWDATCGTSRDIQVPRFVWRIHSLHRYVRVCVSRLSSDICRFGSLVRASGLTLHLPVLGWGSLGTNSPMDPWRKDRWMASGGLGKQFWYVIMYEESVPRNVWLSGEMNFYTSECGNFELFYVA